MRRALAACLLAAAGCAQVPEQRGLPREWVPAANFDERRPAFVVIHHTSNPNVAHSLDILTKSGSGVSAHYLIGRDGRLYQLVDERQRAWHAGDSYWGGNTDLNSASIGIELDNNGEEPFAEPQIAALLALLAELRERYRIPAANFIGHADVAPRRKEDPSRFFPWKRLAEQGFGLWCDAPTAPTGESVVMLQAFGYDVSDPAAAATAFRRHFRGEHRPGAELDETERGLLACLLAQKRR